MCSQQRGSLWRLCIHMASFPQAGQRRGSRGLHFRPDEQSPVPFGPSSPECQPTSTNQGGEGTLGSAATARGGEGPRCPCAVAPKWSDPKSRPEGCRWEEVKGSTAPSGSWDIGDIGDGGRPAEAVTTAFIRPQALGARSAQPCGAACVRSALPVSPGPSVKHPPFPSVSSALELCLFLSVLGLPPTPTMGQRMVQRGSWEPFTS